MDEAAEQNDSQRLEGDEQISPSITVPVTPDYQPNILFTGNQGLTGFASLTSRMQEKSWHADGISAYGIGYNNYSDQYVMTPGRIPMGVPGDTGYSDFKCAIYSCVKATKGKEVSIIDYNEFSYHAITEKPLDELSYITARNLHDGMFSYEGRTILDDTYREMIESDIESVELLSKDISSPEIRNLLEQDEVKLRLINYHQNESLTYNEDIRNYLNGNEVTLNNKSLKMETPSIDAIDNYLKQTDYGLNNPSELSRTNTYIKETIDELPNDTLAYRQQVELAEMELRRNQPQIEYAGMSL
jgi:hypothetical protein